MKCDWWVKDHSSRSYDLREEIKNWRGYWVPAFKCWRIDGITPDSDAFKVLTASGLALEWVQGSERKYSK